MKRFLFFFLPFAFCLLPFDLSFAQMRVGEVAEVYIETPHPYPNGTTERPIVWSHTLRHPGATFLKVHFAAFVVAGSVQNGVSQGDYVTIRDSEGIQHEVLSGTSDDVWTRAVPGDAVIIELHADATGNAAGVVIDRYGYGTVPLSLSLSHKGRGDPLSLSQGERADPPDFPASVCGQDNKTSICDALVPERVRLADAVGRLLFVSDCGGLFACTGFLFTADGQFMTNAHCANSQRESRSMEVWFNYIDDGTGGGGRALDAAASCAVPGRSNPDSFRAEKFLATDCDLDVAVHRLRDPVKGNPADIYGHVQLSARPPVAGEAVWIPQHAGGRSKTIAEVDAAVVSSALEGINFCNDRPHCGGRGGVATGALTEFGYTADTEPGSSGSPILDENNLVIGLHHAGGCTATGGENSGIAMASILSSLFPPTAVFSTEPKHRNGRLPFTLTFDGSASSDPDGGGIAEYRWDFGDGSPLVIGPAAVATHTYTQKGTFRVFLHVVDDDGAASDKAATKQVIVRQ